MGLIRKQRGITLLVGMIMLVLLTLMAVAAMKLGNTNFAVVNRQQTRAEAVRASEQVIEQIVANPSILMTGGNNLFGNNNNAQDIDVTGDGVGDYTVVVTAPTCEKQQVVPQASLNFELDSDLECSRSQRQETLGIEGAGSGDSKCSDVTWDTQATANDQFSTVSVTVVQGIGQRVGTARVTAYCG